MTLEQACGVLRVLPESSTDRKNLGASVYIDVDSLDLEKSSKDNHSSRHLVWNLIGDPEWKHSVKLFSNS